MTTSETHRETEKRQSVVYRHHQTGTWNGEKARKIRTCGILLPDGAKEKKSTGAEGKEDEEKRRDAGLVKFNYVEVEV